MLLLQSKPLVDEWSILVIAEAVPNYLWFQWFQLVLLSLPSAFVVITHFYLQAVVIVKDENYMCMFFHEAHPTISRPVPYTNFMRPLAEYWKLSFHDLKSIDQFSTKFVFENKRQWTDTLLILPENE